MVKIEPGPGDGMEVAAYHFSFSQFIQQLPMQALFPFSAALSLLWCGAGYTANLLAIPKPFSIAQFAPLFFVSLLQATPLLCVVSFLLSPPLDSGIAAAALRADFLHVVVVFATFRIAVAVKYAYMPPATYKSRLREFAPTVERMEEQLISGWQFPSLKLIREEVRIAAAQQPMDVAPLRFVTSCAGLKRLHAKLGCAEASALLNVDASAGEGEAPVAVPCVALLEAIIFAANKDSTVFAQRAQNLTFLGSILSTFTTAAVRAAYGVPQLESNVAQNIVIVTHWIANILLLGVALIFINIGAVDHFRRARSSALLGGLLSVQRGAAKPALELAEFENVRAFLAARGMLAAFGGNFHQRLMTCLALQFSVFAAVAAYVAIMLYIAPSGLSGLNSVMCPFILLHVFVAPAFACILLGLIQAAAANKETKGFVAVVAEASLRAQLVLEEDAGKSGVRAAKLPCFGLLKDVERVLRASEDAALVKFFGFEMTYNLAKSFAGAWLTLEFACAYQLFQIVGGK